MASGALSAGILPFRRASPSGEVQVLLGHMGGPFWSRKDEHAWSIFKGEHQADDDPIEAARREFAEETGQPVPEGPLIALGEIKQRAGKRVLAWAVEAPELEAGSFVSNTFEMEWPPRSGRQQTFPEIDRASWLDLADAERKLVAGQVPFLARLVEHLAG